MFTYEIVRAFLKYSNAVFSGILHVVVTII